MLTCFMSDLIEVNQSVVRENVPQTSEPASKNNFFWEIMGQLKGMEQNNMLML